MKREVSIRLDTTEIIAVERCLSDKDSKEALRLLKAIAEKVRYAQATSWRPYFEMSGARPGPEFVRST